jgi:RNA polymerase sigma-70 factor (ECF subfamily)
MSSTSKSAKMTDPSLGLTDEELLVRLQKGESEMFGPLVRRYERELYGYLRRFLGNEALAEDVFQNTFMQVFQRVNQFDGTRPARPWLYKIATNQAIDALRRAGKHASVSLDQGGEEKDDSARHSLAELLAAKDTDPLKGLKEEERRELVRKGVDCLPEHLRLTVLMSYFQGLKYREIADIMGIPVGTVKSRLHLALARLHEAWRQTEALRDA